MGRTREFEPISGVYALIDPRTNRVMYVGQAPDIEHRFRQHINLNRPFDQKQVKDWVTELKREGMRPTVEVLEEATWPHTDPIEARYIRDYKVNCQCELNRARGGQYGQPGGAADGGNLSAFNGHKNDWHELGRAIKEARVLLREIEAEASRLGGTVGKRPMKETVAKFDRAKHFLEGIMRREFPEWSNISQLFTGPDNGPPE